MMDGTEFATKRAALVIIIFEMLTFMSACGVVAYCWGMT